MKVTHLDSNTCSEIAYEYEYKGISVTIRYILPLRGGRRGWFTCYIPTIYRKEFCETTLYHVPGFDEDELDNVPDVMIT